MTWHTCGDEKTASFLTFHLGLRDMALSLCCSLKCMKVSRSVRSGSAL